MSLSILTITERAAQRVQALMKGRDKPAIAVRISLKSKGCSGLSYGLEFADQVGPYDEMVEAYGVKVLIDPKAVMFLMGTQMDYVEETLSSGFVFKNPNEKGRCGCGESFHV